MRASLVAVPLLAACAAGETPKTSLLSGPDAETAVSSATFTFEGSGEGFQCRVDGDDWADCASPHTEEGLLDGSRVFEVRAVGARGVVDPDPPRWVWHVDTVPAAGSSELSASAADAVVGAEIRLALVVRNAAAVPIPGVAVDLAVSGAGHTLGDATGTTDADGAFETTLSSTVAEDKVVSVTAAEVALGAVDVRFTAGAPVASTSSITSSPLAVGSAADLVVAIRDAHGNGVPGVAVDLAVTGTGNTLGADSGTTDARGEVATTLATTVAEDKTVTAEAGDFVLQADLTAAAGPPAEVSLVADPAGLTTDETTTLTATLRDAHGNRTPGVAVAWSATGTGHVFGAPAGTADAEGVVATTLASTVAEDKTVTLAAGGVEEQVVVTFGPGAPAQATSSVTGSGPVVADGSSVSTVEVVVHDAGGNPVPSVPVSLGATGDGNTLGATSGATGDGGIFATTLASTVAEDKTLTAQVAGFELQDAVSFIAGAPSADTSTLAAEPDTALADGVETIALELTVRDPQGNPVPGAAVAWSATGEENVFSSDAGTTDANGTATTALSSTRGGTRTVSATADGVAVAEVPVAFQGTLEIVLGMSPANPGAGHPADLTVTVQDHDGAVVTDYEGTITLQGSAGVSAPATVTFTAADAGARTLDDAVWAPSGSHTLTASWPDDGPTTLPFSSAAGTLTEATVAQDRRCARCLTDLTATFTLDGLLPADGVVEIEIERPSMFFEWGFYPPYELGAVFVEGASIPGTFTVEGTDTGSVQSPSSRTLTLHRSAASDVPPGSTVTVDLGDLENPAEPEGGMSFRVRTTTSDGVLIDEAFIGTDSSLAITEPWTDPRPGRVRFLVETAREESILDYTVGFEVPIAPGMAPDLSDLRVRDAEGNAMPHWVERSDEASALVWTRLGEIPPPPVPSDPFFGLRPAVAPFFVYFGDTTEPDAASFEAVFPDKVTITSDRVLGQIAADWVEVASGVTLTLVAEQVNRIEAARIIVDGNVVGKGYLPSSASPGPGTGVNPSPVLAGSGGGGGYGGAGSGPAESEGSVGPAYGATHTRSVLPGSAGAPGYGGDFFLGGHGGGALELRGYWIDVHGDVDVSGGDGWVDPWNCDCSSGGGSGGGFLAWGYRLDLDGMSVDASGGNPGNEHGGGGGGGRVKLFGNLLGEGSYGVHVSGGDHGVRDDSFSVPRGETGTLSEGDDGSRVYGVVQVDPPETF